MAMRSTLFSWSPEATRQPLDLLDLAVAALGGGVVGAGLEVGDDLGEPPVAGPADLRQLRHRTMREPAEQLAESAPQPERSDAV